MLFILGAGFILAVIIPFIHRITGRWTAYIASLYPVAVFIYLLQRINSPITLASINWVSALDLDLSIRLDGLSQVLALLVSGIGALVLIYGGAYLKSHPYLGRFYGLILFFMASMLGVVCSDNSLLLFGFWELTGISSFLLIGFDHDNSSARAAAWQALLVTGAGSLAMLIGFILIFQISGSWSIQAWIENSALIKSSSLYPAIFWLILAGAATKSAQFPFHFWLPNAMAAPTPISAYLHSATMVKAGVFLLARFLPVLGGTVLWQTTLPILGILTLLAAGLLMTAQHDLKKLLAYTTVGALGSMVCLIGLENKYAIEALVVFILAHGLYKGALFLVSGAIDHSTGTRDVRILYGLAKKMPFSLAAALPAALSMAGILPLLGFVAKELVYEAGLASPQNVFLLIGMILGNGLMAAGAGWVGVKPFFKRQSKLEARDFQRDHIHEGSFAFWLPPLILSFLSLTFGLAPCLLLPLAKSAATAITQQNIDFKLTLWHGFTPALGWSALTLLLAGLVYLMYSKIEPRALTIFTHLKRFGPADLYNRGIQNLKRLAAWQTSILQSGYLRRYIITIIMTTVLFAVLIITRYGIELSGLISLSISGVRFYDVILTIIIIVSAILATRTQSRLATIALLGSIGYSIALIYLFYSAPDLAMVQIAIETLTVILFILVIYRLPKFDRITTPPRRRLDMVVAALGGGLMTILMLLVSSNTVSSPITDYYLQNSVALANGRNVVNVILVDFRGLDTFGEISVLAIAALGVLALVGPSLEKNFPVRILKEDADINNNGKSGMHRSIILPVAARYLMPLMLLFSIFLLIRGHNEAGGGFVGGLVAAAGFMLYGIAKSPQSILRLIPAQPRTIMAIGLSITVLSVSMPLFTGLPLMTGLWYAQPVAFLGKIGTPLLFDLGVYLIVIAITLMILINVAREESPR